MNQGGETAGLFASYLLACRPPSTLARGGHRDVREVATPLYGETFGAGVTGPMCRLCGKHIWVAGRGLSAQKRTQLYHSLVQQQPHEWHALLTRSLAGGREVRCPIHAHAQGWPSLHPLLATSRCLRQCSELPLMLLGFLTSR